MSLEKTIESAGDCLSQLDSIADERRVLGALLLNRRAVGRAVTAILTESEFSLPQHRLIFRQIVRMADAGDPVDVLTVATSLDDCGELGRVGGIGYLSALAQSVEGDSAVDIDASARLVRDYSDLRQQGFILSAQIFAIKSRWPHRR